MTKPELAVKGNTYSTKTGIKGELIEMTNTRGKQFGLLVNDKTTYTDEIYNNGKQVLKSCIDT